jgi:hypothetical protein
MKKKNSLLFNVCGHVCAVNGVQSSLIGEFKFIAATYDSVMTIATMAMMKQRKV